MPAEFVDTNILFYANDIDDVVKHRIAMDLIHRLAADDCGAVSTQVLVEFYSAATRKTAMTPDYAESVVRDLSTWMLHRPTHQDILDSIRLQQRDKISFWDALVVNSAICVGAETLWTEDLNHGQKFGPLTIRNPFLS
jgi:predicted nucleic acid-binding protein